LKVRTHPDGLNITAANKIRSGTKLQVAFSGQLSQVTVFQKDQDIQEHNFKHTDQWLTKLGANDSIDGSRLIWKGVDSRSTMGFLSNFRTHPACRKAETDLLNKYIEKLNTYGELVDWTIVLLQSSRSKNKYPIAGNEIGLIERADTTEADQTKASDLYMLANSNILNPSDESIDLTENQMQDALELTISDWKKGNSRSKNKPERPSGRFIRKIRKPQKGLLLIYPLDHNLVTHNGETFSGTPIIGFALSFPTGSKDEKVEYQVNTRYWQDRYSEDESDA